MKKTISFLIVPICLFVLISCSQSKPQVDFVQLCFEESPGRSGIPLSQIELLYEGVKKAGDTSAKQTLRENCPKAAAEHLK
ncbi:hypothetical protein KJ966_02135 [bacterium]|nr:hypothetical protein [bacterium]